MSVAGGFAASAPARATARALAQRVRAAAAICAGRAEFYAWPGRRSFVGAYPSYAAAMEAVPKRFLAGYSHDAITDVAFDGMCRVTLADYPVLFWLRTLGPQVRSVLDAGGHMGTKYRAFDPLLFLSNRVAWTVLETPPMARAGAARAAADGLTGLSFISDPADAAPVDCLLASGLFQYYDGALSDLLAATGLRPRHILVNKIAVREGPTVVTLERIGASLVPYQIRNRAEVESDVAALGYRVVDRWTLPHLSHTVRSHPELGASTSMGFYLLADAPHTSGDVHANP